MTTTEIVETAAEVMPHEQSPQTMISNAIEKGMDISKLERLFDLQERWEKNNARKAFLKAMSNFQSEVPVLEKKKLVAFGNTKYKYAELGEITQTIQPSLTKHGLSYRWQFDDTDKGLQCTCIISHIEGHSEQTTMTAGADKSGGKNEIQARASATTYLSRYTLIGALGLSTANEDTDGRQEQPEQPKQAERPSEPPTTKRPDSNELTELTDTAFKKALDVIAKGDITMLDKLKKSRKMTPEQLSELEKVHSFAVNMPSADAELPIEVESVLRTPTDLQGLQLAYDANKEWHHNTNFNSLYNEMRLNLTKAK